MERGQVWWPGGSQVPRASLLTSSPVKAPEVSTGAVPALAQALCEPACGGEGLSGPREGGDERDSRVWDPERERRPGGVF